MIIIHFGDPKAKRRALGYLAGRYSFKSWASGKMMVSEDAVLELAKENIPFQVDGPPSLEQLPGSTSHRESDHGEVC